MRNNIPAYLCSQTWSTRTAIEISILLYTFACFCVTVFLGNIILMFDRSAVTSQKGKGYNLQRCRVLIPGEPGF